MSDIPSDVVALVEDDVRGEFSRIWQAVTGEPLPEYRIIVWGSTVDDRDREPVDLDLIFEYDCDPIDQDKENSIESWLKDSIDVADFAYIDPLVTHYLNTSEIISRSRSSRVYSIDESEWLEFD